MKQIFPILLIIILVQSVEVYCQVPQIKWWYDVKDMSYGNACAGDIDKDGKLEIVFGCYRNDSCVYALNAEDGTLLWKYNTGGCNDAAPVIYDADNDDTLDILLTSSCVPKTFCINGATGRVKWIANSNGSDSPPTIGDIDNDGKQEMLFGEFNGNVRCLNIENGNLKWVLTVDTNSQIQTEPALLDLDDDGMLDFVVANWNFDTTHCIYGYRGYDHTLLWKTSAPNNVMYHGASFADIDGDNKPELAIGSYDGHLYVLNGEDGSIVFDFSFLNVFYIGAPTSIADLDNDGFYEIVFINYSKISAVNHNGELLWSQSIPYCATSFRGAAISDVNNDGILDVVYGSSKGDVIALSGRDGSYIWDINLADHIGKDFNIDHGPIIADFDQDGYLDVFVVGGYSEYPAIQNNYGRAYAISIGSKGGPDWLMFRRDIRRSACVPINTTDIKDNYIKSDFTIYPNPANDYITINLNDIDLINNSQIQIFDILGNESKCPLIRNSDYLKIDISNLSSGIYIIKLKGNLMDDSRKIFVKI